MGYSTNEEEKFKFIETNPQQSNTLLLLHGLFGALSNFSGIINHFGSNYNVVVPILPIFELPIRKVSVAGLVDYVVDFVNYRGYENVNILGNSLGGHVALLYALQCPEKLRSITLTGSSGLFESALGTGFPKRGDYNFIKEKTEATFYDPAVASKELVDEVFDTVNDRGKAIRVIATAKSAVRHNLGDKLHQIKTPTLLIWGREDAITPAFVGEKFHELLENSELVFVEECGHAPMMEKPQIFNRHLEEFLEQLKTGAVESVG